MPPIEKPYYPIEDLNKFARFTRSTYPEAHKGAQAPPWDRKRQIKRWEDPDAPDTSAPYQYDAWDPVLGKITPYTITGSEARKVNLPGIYAYQKWQPESTDAVVNDGQRSNPVNPETLCTREEAEALATELEEVGTFTVGKVYEQSVSGSASVDWKKEKRRQWLIPIGGQIHSAPLLLGRKYKQGVGAPGHWFGTDGSGPMWMSDKQDTGERDNRPEIPIPVRALSANEALKGPVGPMSAYFVIRTDIESELNPAAPSGGAVGGGLTSTQAAQLARIDVAVQELLTK